MSAMYNQVLVHWVDKNGEVACSFLTALDQAPEPPSGYVALASALQNCSDAAVIALQFQSTLLIEATPADGAYCTVFDRGMLRAKITTTGQDSRVNILGPSESIFLPGNLKIDLTNANVLELQTQVMSLLGDRSGHAFGPFFRGRRQEASPVT